MLGLEQDASRVATASLAYPSLTLVAGGLEQLRGEALVVRIANVGRGLSRDAAAELHERVVATLVDGGVCLEGSTDLEGHVSTFWVLRRRGGSVRREALVFHTDGARGFSPWLFRDVLPRDLRRDVRPGTAVHQLLTGWTTSWERCRTGAALESFEASVRALAELRPDVDAHLIVDGFCVWQQ